MSLSHSGIPANVFLTVDDTNLALSSKQDEQTTVLNNILEGIATGITSVINSSDTPLNASATFPGASEQNDFPTVLVVLKTDQSGVLTCEFSADGVNWDSSLTFLVEAGVNEIHRLVKAGRFYRTSFTNTSASNQIYFRLRTYYGSFPQLTSTLNSVIQKDSDASVTRSVSEEFAIAVGLFQDFSIVNKFGNNADIRSSTIPEDVWEGGGLYTGWATAAQTVDVFSSSANDTAAGTGARTVRLIGLDANYAVQEETVTLNGVTPVATLNTFIRVHTAQVVTAGSGGVNAGTITFRQSVTTTNIFLLMQIGRNQTNTSAYTVPAGHTAYMRKLHAACGQQQAVAVEGHIWTRAFGGVFRSRRPFYIGNAFRLVDDIYGGLIFTEKSDIIIRIVGCTTNTATPVNAGYDLILVKN